MHREIDPLCTVVRSQMYLIRKYTMIGTTAVLRVRVMQMDRHWNELGYLATFALLEVNCFNV